MRIVQGARPFLAKWCASISLFAALLTPAPPAAAFCDSCVATAITASTTAIVAAVGSLHVQLGQVGFAIGALVNTNTALLTELHVINQKGFETLVLEDHARVSKQASLELKRDINDAFSTVSSDHCYAVEASLGKVDTATPEYQDALLMAKTFSNEIKSNTKSPALRRRIMEEYVPEGIDIGRYFSAQQTLNEQELLHVPAITHVLSQSVVFPVAPAKTSDKENDLSRYYRELKRERDTHGGIVEDALARAILSNAPVVKSGNFVREMFEGAGLDHSQYVQGDMTSESAVVKAIGHSTFGNVVAVRHSAYSGEELMRILISEVGKTNYVLSKQYEALKDIRYLQTLGFAKQVESFYETRLEQAFVRLN